MSVHLTETGGAVDVKPRTFLHEGDGLEIRELLLCHVFPNTPRPVPDKVVPVPQVLYFILRPIDDIVEEVVEGEMEG
jgi:hypothetical protein